MTPKVKISHTLVSSGARQTGQAAVNLRIMREDNLVYDWDDGTFKALGAATTPVTAGTELDATNDPGYYYWVIGSGGSYNGVFPAVFTDGDYRFELDCAALSYSHAYPVAIRKRRALLLLVAQFHQNDRTLADGATDNFELLEDDGSTVLLTKSVRDKAGGAISISSGVPAQEVAS